MHGTTAIVSSGRRTGPISARRPTRGLAAIALIVVPLAASGQTFPTDDAVIRRIWTEGMDSSQAYPLAQALLDSIGPRLIGSPAHRAGNDWLVAMYRRFGIEARNERYGTWRGWRRGHTHVDLIAPRVRTLDAMMVAWSPGTRGRIEGPVILLPDAADSMAFAAWLPQARGAFVLTSFAQPTCRQDASYRQFGGPILFEQMVRERTKARNAWTARLARTGLSSAELERQLAQAGARGVLKSTWSGGWGTIRVFGTRATGAPVLEVGCEDYGLLFRLAERSQGPVLRVEAQSRALGEVPVFNTIAEIRGSERPGEYVMLSAHLDSWDGSSAATDNGTGTVIMLEAMRILRKAYPNPKRTILVGHWGGEEQGLNGSGAFAADHPEILRGLHALFNQDEGTGLTTDISMEGFTEAGSYFARWFSRIPPELTRQISLDIPGRRTGGTDHGSFVCHGAPAFSLSATRGASDWEYGPYTWHTNRDTFDKVVFENVRANATLVAALAYLAAEDRELMPRDRIMPRSGLATPQQPRPSACATPARTSAESTR